MIYLRPGTSEHPGYGPVAAILLIGLTLTGAVFLSSHRLETKRLRTEFDRLTDDRAHAARRHLEMHIDSLFALRGYFETSEIVTAEEFDSFAGMLLERTPGTQALEWIPRVVHEERAGFEARVRTNVDDAFAIRERGDDGELVAAASRPEYYPVSYVAPVVGNEEALGFDILSDPTRREAMLLAGSSGRAVATEPVFLVQESGRQTGVLIFVPVYGRDVGPEVPPCDSCKPIGFVLGVLRAGDLLGTALFGLDPTDIHVELYDMEAGAEFQRLASFPERAVSEAVPDLRVPTGGGDLSGRRQIEAAGRVWTVECHATRHFFLSRSSATAWGALAAGLFVTFATAGYKSVSIRRKVIERALGKVRERNETILSNVFEAVVTLDDGIVTGWEGLAESLFGWSEEEAVGRSLRELIVPARYHDEYLRRVRALLAGSDNGRPEGRIELMGRHRDGEEFPVEMALAAMGGDEPAGFCAFIHDISDRKKIEEELREGERRFRALVENATEALVVFNVETGRFEDVNENAVQLFKIDRAELLRMSPVELSPPVQPNGQPSAEYARQRLEEAMNGATPVFEWLHHDRNGKQFLCEVRLVRLPPSRRRLVRGSITDITERKRAKARQTFLVRELDHRVKNVLAAVLAIAERSIAGSGSLEAFEASFSGRIRALSRLHEALARAHWEGVEVNDLVSLTLGAFSGSGSARVRVDGAATMMSARESSSICMALHELATNASKYGSLSTPEGHVAIRWRRRVADHALVFDWMEVGGPPVCKPEHRGFGLELIRGVVEYELRGELTLRFEAEGLKCKMIIPDRKPRPECRHTTSKDYASSSSRTTSWSPSP